MRVITTVKAMHQYSASLPTTVELGLVPTMGYLHAGHLKLVEVARRENPCVVVSLFVNPTQFGPGEDFQRYPRDLDKDLSLLESAGVDGVFVPRSQDVYPEGFSTFVEVEGALGTLWEAQSRPGHFRGVATVVTKLFNMVRPHRAYFGQKDAQQLAVIRRLERDLNLGVAVEAVPTVREEDGLAMSSRNTYLSPPQRQAATVLYRSFQQVQELVGRGERSADVIEDIIRGMIQGEKRAKLDYVAVVDPETFCRVDCLEQAVLVLLAVWVGTTRLIDNWRLEV